MLKGFKDFALKGNLIEVAVGLVMALAIFALVQALIESLITPLIGAVVGEPDFGGLTFTINGSEFFYGEVHQRADHLPLGGRSRLLLHGAAVREVQAASRHHDRHAPMPRVHD